MHSTIGAMPGGGTRGMVPPQNLEGWDIVARIPPPKKIVGTSPECRPPPPIINAELRHCIQQKHRVLDYLFSKKHYASGYTIYAFSKIYQLYALRE